MTSFKGFNDEELTYTGTQINYYFVCKRKLWFFSHGVELEPESDLVQLGRLLHEHSYKRKFKEVQVGRIKVDFLERKETHMTVRDYNHELTVSPATGKPSVVLHEVKRSRSMHDAHVFQLLYYIYYLQKNYGVNTTTGILHYPLLKTNVPVELTAENASQVEKVLDEIRQTISSTEPPPAVWIKPCKSCAYREMCWS
jgi:CRISPR-associated exonuclease Cas4